MQQVTLTEQGIPGDRCWALKDEARGNICGAKRFPALLNMHARLHEEPRADKPSPLAELTLPGGEHFLTDTSDINQRLSNALGAKVSLWPLLPKNQLDHYRRVAPEPNTDQEAALREVFGRLPDEPLPDLSVFPRELFEYESPPGTYFDAFPLLLLSQASLDTLQSASDAHIDVRRFRPNLLLDIDQPGFPEQRWVGKQIRIGEATLQVEIECPRCIMTTHPLAELPKEPGVMRSLVQTNGGNLGVYANVVQAGRIRVGDSVQVL